MPRPLEVKADGLMRQEENGSRQRDALVNHSSPSPATSISAARVRQAPRHDEVRSSSRRSKERKGEGLGGGGPEELKQAANVRRFLQV